MQEPIKTGDRATIIAGALGDKGPNVGKQVTVGWLQDGSLLYRLTDGRQPQNRDEINVTMAGGYRDEQDRAAMASALLGMMREQYRLEDVQ